MRDQILQLLADWKSRLEQEIVHNGIYLFGSLVNRKGAFFKQDKSDVDLLIVIPDELESDFGERTKWLIAFKKHKTELEQKLVFLLKRSDNVTQIVSLLPVSKFEISYDIHKSNAKPFFAITNFLEIGTNKLVKGVELSAFSDFPDKLLEQVFAAVQGTRNTYLNCSAVHDPDLLRYDEPGSLPKSICREAAKINSYSIKNISDNGDYYSLSFGRDFLKNEARSRIDDSRQFEQIYNWIDGAASGFLSADLHLLLFELLYDKARTLASEERNNKSTLRSLEIEINEYFLNFLNSSELLEQSHPSVVKLTLKDVLIYPELDVYDNQREFHENIRVNEFLDNFIGYGNTLVAGEGQSGKTVLCKLLYQKVFQLGYVPIYVEDRKNKFAGDFLNKIKKAFEEQYDTSVDFDDIPKIQIVPIVDNFQYAINKTKIITTLNDFHHHLIVVDDVFGLNFSNELLIKTYNHFNLKELNATLRNELIEKWVDLGDKDQIGSGNENERLAQIDKFTELIESTLGKILGDGIMPAYPFFILSIISTYEVAHGTLKMDITSQGHCYHALIYLYLTNNGVKDAEIDTYLNFMAEFAAELYRKERKEIAKIEFDAFIEKYDTDFNLTIEIEELLKHLSDTNIIKQDSLGNYSFCYEYVYYYFAGMYFADDIESKRKEITKILENLHNNDFAYIAIFISHHVKSASLLEEIITLADGLFSDHEESKLSKTELSFMDDQINVIAQAILPSASNLPGEERKLRLKEQDKLEKTRSELEDLGEIDAQSEQFTKDLRRSIKTVEVMGRIIKNRSGSLGKKQLMKVFRHGMNVHLRILHSFIKLISEPNIQIELVELISNRIDVIIDETGSQPDKDRIMAMAKDVFWNMNFSAIYAFMQKIIHSLGSKELLKISTAVCDEINTPSSRIVQHGVLMWYGKNVQVDNIAKAMEAKDFSRTAESVMKHQIVNHAKMHKIGYKELQKIEAKMNISSKKLIEINMKAN